MKITVDRAIGGSLKSAYGKMIGFDYLFEGDFKFLSITLFFIEITLYLGSPYDDTGEDLEHA